MLKRDCIYPDCQVYESGLRSCEHSCPHEREIKGPDSDSVLPYSMWCLALDVTGASCQFPKCDC